MSTSLLRSRRALVVALAASALAVVPAVAGAAEGPTFPPRTDECKVPMVLSPVAAVVDPGSLEGCGYFEDPNYHENRKANGTYNPNGLFSTLFG